MAGPSGPTGATGDGKVGATGFTGATGIQGDLGATGQVPLLLGSSIKYCVPSDTQQPQQFTLTCCKKQELHKKSIHQKGPEAEHSHVEQAILLLLQNRQPGRCMWTCHIMLLSTGHIAAEAVQQTKPLAKQLFPSFKYLARECGQVNKVCHVCTPNGHWHHWRHRCHRRRGQYR